MNLITNDGSPETKKIKRRKPGIVYLSSIPQNMNVSKLREYFSKFGVLGRVYLQPLPGKASKKSKRTRFSEGWIEFKSKRKAKHVQATLNNMPVGGKKSNPDYDVLWNIKYLPRFKWEFLTKRLEYERQIFERRMRAEISQVNKETDHYVKASKLGKLRNKEVSVDDLAKESKGFIFKQKDTEEEILKKKESKKKKEQKLRKSFEKNKLRKKKSQTSKVNEDSLVDSIFVGGD